MEKTRCYTEISLANFNDNLKGLQAILPQQTKIIGIIKADYYGHGDLVLANEMKKTGINDFAVASLDEALSLRERGLEGSILVLGYIEKQQWLLAKEHNIIITIASLQQAYQMIDFACKVNCQFDCEVKVDTGMHRIGLPFDSSINDLKNIYGSKYLHINGTFSHLCVADSFAKEDKEFTYLQKERFDSFLAKVNSLGLSTGRRHLCASSGILNYPEFVYDAVRPGFMLLGFDVGQTKERYQRKPVLSWYSKVEMVKEIAENEGVSYGLTYKADKPTKIASISVGYGDGYPRCLSNKGYVVIRGHKCPIVGRICMDQMMVDVSGLDIEREDVVTLIGEGVSANDVASLAQTIVDEIVCDINLRVKRFYI